MPRYRFFVDIDVPDEEFGYGKAQTVMTERLGHDEDYGFDYQIPGWEFFRVLRGEPYEGPYEGGD